MKANEAPEKIFLDEDESWHLTNPNGDSIEYIRADAFIEKAKKWIEEHVGLYEAFEPDSRTYYTDIETMVKDFKKYIEGE